MLQFIIGHAKAQIKLVYETQFFWKLSIKFAFTTLLLQFSMKTSK